MAPGRRCMRTMGKLHRSSFWGPSDIPGCLPNARREGGRRWHLGGGV